MRLIDADAAIEAFGLSEKTRKYGGDHSGYNTMMLYEIQDVLDDLPTIEQPQTGKWIEHPHGFWTRLNSGGERDGWLPDYECSVCGSRAWKDVTAYRYCPNCGARMVKE